MKLADWFKGKNSSRFTKQKVKVSPEHIQHRHWKKPAKKSRRLRLRANRWRMQLLSRRRNRGNA